MNINIGQSNKTCHGIKFRFCFFKQPNVKHVTVVWFSYFHDLNNSPTDACPVCGWLSAAPVWIPCEFAWCLYYYEVAIDSY